MPLTTPPVHIPPQAPLAPLTPPVPPPGPPPLSARDKAAHVALVGLGAALAGGGLAVGALIGPAAVCASAGVAGAGLALGLVAVATGVLPLWREFTAAQDSRAWHALIMRQYADYYSTVLDLAELHGESIYHPPAPAKEPEPSINKFTDRARVQDVPPPPVAARVPAWVSAMQRWRQSFAPALPAGAPTTTLDPDDAPPVYQPISPPPVPHAPDDDPYTADMRACITLALTTGGATKDRAVSLAHLTRPRWEAACDALTDAGIFAPPEGKKARTFTPAWAALRTLPVDEAHARVSEQVCRVMQ